MTTAWVHATAGLLDTLSEQPLDPMLALLAQLRTDPRPDKLDLGIGVYRNETGLTPVMAAVKQAEQILVDSQLSKDYLSPEGDPGYLDAIAPLVMGARGARGGSTDERLWAMQTPGGTGALRLAGALIARTNPDARVWLGTPTWANHRMLMQAAGLEVVEHPYFDQATQSLTFDAMMEALKAARAGDVIVLHAGCHNPTGADLDAAQWRTVADFLAERSIIPLIDMAYQGLGDGLDDDVWGLRHVLEAVPEALVSVSFSKNFGLYRDRIGALWVQGSHAASVRRARANLNLIARVLWSMPPDHGASVVRTILTSGTLSALWRSELDTMRNRINGIRSQLAASLPELAPLARQNGMFALLPINRENAVTLRIERGIYMLESGRINLAGLNRATVPAFAEALKKHLKA